MGKQISKPFDEVLAVVLIPEDLLPLYTADNHVVYDTGRIQSG